MITMNAFQTSRSSAEENLQSLSDECEFKHGFQLVTIYSRLAMRVNTEYGTKSLDNQRKSGDDIP